MKTSICLDCKYFLRHYTRRENGSFVPTAFGHCYHPRIKLREVEDPAFLWVCKRRASGPGRRPKPSGGIYFIWKLWQSVHSTLVGLVSWVPTVMVFRPQ